MISLSITYIRKRCALTEIHTYGSTARVGRKKEFEKRITLPLPAEMLARIDAALASDEPRLDMIREAIEAELARREAGRAE